MGFPLNFGQAAALFEEIHRIAPDKSEAFRSRLKHLQRIGFPAGINTGKGRPAEYGLSEVLLLGIALEMIQLGLVPERAAALLTEGRPFVLGEAREALRTFRQAKQRLLLVDPRALSSLQSPEAGYDDTLMFGDLKDLNHRLRGGLRSVVPRLSVIDLKGLLFDISIVVAELGFAKENEVKAYLLAWAEGKLDNGDD